MKTASILIPALLMLLPGCLQPHAFRILIPAQCVKVNITNFTQPCAQLPDQRYVCNGVVITANCVKVVPALGNHP
ncbi:MAG: hypothetical protein JST79_14720 [Acidobacteria bacterium]|nr:hypothetical protein [Acidobacteriota bacterium]